ncbi:MAG: hypothetical protein HA495_03405 [Thaumarchaeota archaeon]|jgi:hypothetical protein|nr:hypothetical protein [Nitrososphaerota archaeon]
MKLYKYLIFFTLLYSLFFVSTLLTLSFTLTTVIEKDIRFILLVLASGFTVSLCLSERDYFEEGLILGVIAIVAYVTFSLTLINLEFLLNSYLEVITLFLSSFFGFIAKRLILEKKK